MFSISLCDDLSVEQFVLVVAESAVPALGLDSLYEDKGQTGNDLCIYHSFISDVS